MLVLHHARVLVVEACVAGLFPPLFLWNSEFTGVSHKMTAVNSEFTGVHHKMAAVNSEFTGVSRNITAVNSEFTGVSPQHPIGVTSNRNMVGALHEKIVHAQL